MTGDQNRQMQLFLSLLEYFRRDLKLLLRILMGISLLFLISCSKQEIKNPKEYYERVLNVPSLPKKIENPAESLNVLCWNDYFPDALFDVFEQIYGTKVNVEYFVNNEELRDKYKQNPEKWDLLMPSDYMVRQFIREGYLRPIERKRLPKIEELNPGLFELECDPGLKYFVPVFQSSLGLSFEVQHMDGFPRHWDYLDSHRKNPYFYGRIALPDQMRIVFAMALLRLGLDPNTTQVEEIQKAEDYLVSFVREFGAKIVGDEIIDPEVLKNYLLILTWNGTGAYLLTVDSNYRFLIPEDKTILSVDGFVISKDTEKVDSCYLFLDYLMTPQIMALLSEYSFYAPASLMAQRYVNSFILNGPSLMIPDVAERLFLKDVGDAEVLYEEAWERVKEAKVNESINTIPLQRFQ
jgi:spermidine/putrescine transport system substrate-binding protein